MISSDHIDFSSVKNIFCSGHMTSSDHIDFRSVQISSVVVI